MTKRKQTEIAGAEASNPELDEYALPLLDAMNDEKKAKSKKKEMRELLMHRMSESGIEAYSVDDADRYGVFSLTSKERLSVRTKRDSGDE